MEGSNALIPDAALSYIAPIGEFNVHPTIWARVASAPCRWSLALHAIPPLLAPTDPNIVLRQATATRPTVDTVAKVAVVSQANVNISICVLLGRL